MTKIEAINLFMKKKIDLHKELFQRKEFSLFCTENNEVHGKQLLALESLLDNSYSDVFYGGAAGGGKSFVGCFWLTMMALMYPDTSWFVCRQSLTDLRNSVTNTFVKVWKKLELSEIPKYNGIDHFWSFKNGSNIVYLSAEHQPRDPFYERFGSREFTGGWFEEAGQISSLAYDIAKSRAGRQMNKEYQLPPKTLSTFNPSKGFIYSEVYKPYKEKKLPSNQIFIPALVTDNPHVSQDYIENLKNLKNKVQKERLLYGNFDYDDDPNKLYDYDCILNMFSNSFVSGGMKCITADIALSGADKLVIMVWNGFRIEHIHVEKKSKASEIEQTIKDLAEKYQVPRNNIVFDNDGVGAFLNSYLDRAIPFVNNAAPFNKENYQNLKTQCYFKLQEYINKNEMYCADTEYKEEITEELDIISQKDVDKDGKLRIIKKEEVKEKIGRSPDFADNFMMRMYFEVMPSKTINVISLNDI